MSYKVKFKSSVEKDLRKIAKKEGEKILQDISNKLAKDPRLGIPLKGNKDELWRYRIGDYRVIYSFSDIEVWILVVHIAHRKEVYR
ncbi:MAG: type II toxin-antitoxin system RelE/ParE family toxin [Gammaproteobacteria bacterium]|nr:type II toxin-antitoxin system RelE/ParE family toxin [Gammaproteobacteria bacterium]